MSAKLEIKNKVPRSVSSQATSDTVDTGFLAQCRGIDVSLNSREHSPEARVGLELSVNGTGKGQKKGKSKQDSPVSLGETSETSSVKPTKAKKKQEVVKVQCQAARSDKKRCTRIATKDSNMCYWHVEHLTYGIYAEEPTVKKGKKQSPGAKGEKSKVAVADAKEVTTVEAESAPTTEGQQPSEPPKPKTRGRKRKQAIDPRFNDPAYITMWPEICDGICVLVDRYDNVYTYGTEPVTFLGVKLLTGKIDRTANPRV